MKTALTLIALLFAVTVNGQTGAFASDCPTLAQQQEQYNKNIARGITVVDSRTQQLQTHYWQLGVYYQQLHKDEQQRAKDIQQRDKDIQQVQKEQQLIAWEIDLKSREAALVACNTELYNLKLLVEELRLLIDSDDCECAVAGRLRLHFNHSGGADGTNPGGGGNDNGYLNPHN